MTGTGILATNVVLGWSADAGHVIVSDAIVTSLCYSTNVNGDDANECAFDGLPVIVISLVFLVFDEVDICNRDAPSYAVLYVKTEQNQN